jgi:hypothetical protein
MRITGDPLYLDLLLWHHFGHYFMVFFYWIFFKPVCQFLIVSAFQSALREGLEGGIENYGQPRNID